MQIIKCKNLMPDYISDKFQGRRKVLKSMWGRTNFCSLAPPALWF
jgi:hypothetical protein